MKKSAHLVYEGRWADYPKHEFVNFGVQEWYKPALHVAKGWTKSNLILMFCFGNWTHSASLVLQVGPGDEETRRKLLAMAKSDLSLFESDPSEWGGGKWINIFEKSMLTPEFYENATDAEREREIRKNWADFLENDLPRIDAALKKERWIWESGDDEIEADPSRYEKYGWSDEGIRVEHPDENPEQSGD